MPGDVGAFDARHLSWDTLCVVCGSPTRALRRRHGRPAAHEAREHESVLRALGTEEVATELRVCPGCWHVSRLPRYDERLLYGGTGTRTRREAFERRFPGEAFRGDDGRGARDWRRRLSGVFCFVSRLIGAAWQPEVAPTGDQGIRILDWGGGDGFLGEAISLVSAAALGVECTSFCYDLSPWETAGGPRVRHVSATEVDAHGPYHVLLLSHVLEHVAFPAEVLRGASRHLLPSGSLIVAVPYELPGLSPHQSYFSRASLGQLLAGCGFSRVRTRVAFVPYRIYPMWQILASAVHEPGEPGHHRYPRTADVVTCAGVGVRSLATRVRSLAARLVRAIRRALRRSAP